jgi:hypothetical protein
MRLVSMLVITLVTLVSVMYSTTGGRFLATAGDKQDPKLPPAQPVEKSMHEFMEYLMEPSYLRLKDAMATKDKKNWKAIKADALVLAEGTNLIMDRLPEKAKDKSAWVNFAFAVREAGSQLYQAAKKKDDAVAASAYKTMITKCNACHKQFAEGKHQLVP